MPYRRNTDLPAPVRSHLPDHAQDIYREAFNHAFRELAGEHDRERRAHMIAWAAVKRSYVKAEGDWVAKVARTSSTFTHGGPLQSGIVARAGVQRSRQHDDGSPGC